MADGISDAKFAAEGALCAVDVLRKHVGERLARAPSKPQAALTALLQDAWIDAAAAWEMWASAEIPASERASTTLAFCYAFSPWFWFFSVGDSFAAVLTADDEVLLPLAEVREEGAGYGVQALSSRTASACRPVVIRDPLITAIFLSTDGLEPLLRRPPQDSGVFASYVLPDKVIGAMLTRFRDTGEPRYVTDTVEDKQKLKEDDVGVAVAVRRPSPDPSPRPT